MKLESLRGFFEATREFVPEMMEDGYNVTIDIQICGVFYSCDGKQFLDDMESSIIDDRETNDDESLFVITKDGKQVFFDAEQIGAIVRYETKNEEKQSEPTKIIATITPTDGRRISQIDFVKLRKFGDYDDEKYINSGHEKLEFSFLTKELFEVWFDRVKGLKFNKKYCLILTDKGQKIEYSFGGKDGK